jgi:hypothetical protein
VHSSQIPERSAASDERIHDRWDQAEALGRSDDTVAHFRGLLVAKGHEVGTGEPGAGRDHGRLAEG